MKYLVLLLLSISVNYAFGQRPKIEYYIYDKEWKAAKSIPLADYVVQRTTIGDTLFIDRIFKGTGHLWKQESFADVNSTIAKGEFAWYDDEGRIDSMGQVKDNKKAGTWCYYNDTLGMILSINFEDGKEVLRRDYINKIIKGAGWQKTFDEEKREQDSVNQSMKASGFEEKEASFTGGMKGYKKYLEANLKAPENLIKSGTVKVQFLINKSGKIEHLLIHRSLQLSADIEAIRVLTEMPDWTPAQQNGKNVIYQAIQYIGFQIS